MAPEPTPSAALVVGGASGIGAAVAARHRSEGAPVHVWDIQGERDVTCDVTDASAIDAAVDATAAAIGVPTRITVCAGIGHASLLVDLDSADWDRVMAVNARGPLLVARAWARRMIGEGVPGSMVVISSVSARIVDRTMAAYSASKAALEMVARVAAAEWAPAGIRVNAIAPGVTDTPLLGGAPTDRGWLADVAGRTALGAIGTADQVAEAIIGLHAMGWVTGQVLASDGGLGLHSPIDSYAEALRFQRRATRRD